MDINGSMQYYNPDERTFNPLPLRTGAGATSDSDGMIRSSAISAAAGVLSFKSTSAHGLVLIDHPDQERAPLSLATASDMTSDTIRSSHDQVESSHGDMEPKPPYGGKGVRFQLQRPQTARRGKGRATHQAAIIPMTNNIRDKSLAETRCKRARLQENELLEAVEETMLIGDDLGVTTVSKLGKKRAEYSCDHCFLRKTRCHRRVDGKPPNEQFPCDYCSNLSFICSTYVADAKRPDSFVVTMEKNYKRREYSTILNDGVERDNVELRLRLGSLEEKLEMQTKVHEEVRRQLAVVEKQNRILEIANGQATATWETACNLMKKLSLSGLEGKVDDSVLTEVAPQSLDGFPPHSQFGEIGSNTMDQLPQQPPKHFAIPGNAVINHPNLKSSAAVQQSVVQSREATRREVFQRVRTCELPCNNINVANACLSAYFRNVHPLLPVLHRKAFYSLYQLYRNKALSKNSLNIRDASSREGRAVTLICSVLALGALTLNEQSLRETGTLIDGSQISMGFGFYGTCVRLCSYSHDTIETMLAYLFMGIFAVHCTDLRESFRRLQQFQTGAIAVNLPLDSKEKDPGVTYDPELWPKVSNLVIFEMAKRSWALFKVYVNNVCVTLGRRARFYELDVELPKPIDDQYLDLDSSKVDEWAQAPNPVSFLLVSESLSRIVKSYSEMAFPETFLPKHRKQKESQELIERLRAWECTIPTFLRWEKHSNDELPLWMMMQRKRLQSQYNCIAMKLWRSLAHLQSVAAPIYSQLWELEGSSHQAACTVLEVAKECTALNKDAGCLYHADAIRATISLLQILLRNPSMERQQLENSTAACQDGIAICRSLVPKEFTKAEDTFEQLLNEHLERLDLSASELKISGLNYATPERSLEDNSSIFALFEKSFEDPLFLESSAFQLDDSEFTFNM